MLSIFLYTDYRLFLRDAYALRKQKDRYFSYSYIAQKSLMDKSSLIKVMQGERHLTVDRAVVMARVFGLTDAEQQYFEKSVQYGRCPEGDEKEKFFDELQNLKPLDQRILERSQYDFFNNWYYIAIWSIIGVKPCNFETDFCSLVMPRISQRDVDSALAALVDLGLIFLGEDGFFQRCSSNVSLSQNWSSIKVDEFLKKSLMLSDHAMVQLPKEEQDISAIIVDCPSSKFGELKKMIADFRKSLIRKVNSYGPSDRVYQLSVQLFPLTVKIGKDSYDK